MGKKVLVAGHICLDITPVFPDKRMNQVSDILLPGKLIEMKEADVHTGGAVANTGIAMKLLGADVSVMGKVGTDAFGDIICHILEKYDMAAKMIRTPESSTSYTIVLAIPGIDRTFLHHPGANESFLASDVPDGELEEAALFHLGYPPIMKAMYQKNGEELVTVYQKAKRAGCATSMDMAAVDAASEAGKADWNEILKRVLPYVDFFVPSVEELCYMLDRDKFEELQKRANGKDSTEVLDIEKDVRPLAKRCMSYGAKVLLLKCGAPGIYYRTAGKNTLQEVGGRVELDAEAWADKEGFERSYVPDRILSATGAGDTSIAAFLTAMLKGYSIEKCVQLATAAGASCVEAYDALSGLKSFDELQDKIDAGWKKNR